MDLNEILKVYKEDFKINENEFLKVQCIFLSDIYQRYNNDLDCANIVLFFAKRLHYKILRERDKDLDYDISFKNFWNNHHKLTQDDLKTIDVANQTGLPKETARRKIQVLLKHKVLKKTGKRIYWSPTILDENSYNKIVSNHIGIIARLISNLLLRLNLKIPTEIINKLIVKNFSFYWYHFLNTQLNFLKYWKNNLNDLELLLIAIECCIQGNLIITNKHQGISEKIISANTISNITGIPRATCVRKLAQLHKLKLIEKDSATKKYYIAPGNMNNNRIFTKESESNITVMFAEFFLIIIRALKRKENVF